MWKSCGERESIGSAALSQLRVSALPRTIFVSARQKNGPVSAFLAIISSGAKDKDAIWLSNYAARGSPSTLILTQSQCLTCAESSNKKVVLLWGSCTLSSPFPATPGELLSPLERSARALSGAFARTEATNSPLNSFSHHVLMSGNARTALCQHTINSCCDCINGEHYSWMFHHVLIVKDCVFFFLEISFSFFVVSYMHNFHTPWAICHVNKISLIRTLNANSSRTTHYRTVQELWWRKNKNGRTFFRTCSVSTSLVTQTGQ